MIVGVVGEQKFKQRIFKNMNTIGCVVINNFRVNGTVEIKIEICDG